MLNTKDETQKMIIELWRNSIECQNYRRDNRKDVGWFALLFYGRISKEDSGNLSYCKFSNHADPYQEIKCWVQYYEDHDAHLEN